MARGSHERVVAVEAIVVLLFFVCGCGAVAFVELALFFASTFLLHGFGGVHCDWDRIVSVKMLASGQQARDDVRG